METIIIIVTIVVIAVYITAKLVINHSNLPQKMKMEIQWKNALINDLLQLSKTDKVAKDLVTRFNLQDFQVCDMKFIGDKKTLIDYYISVSQAVRNLLKQTVSHTHKKITAQELLDLEKKSLSQKS